MRPSGRDDPVTVWSRDRPMSAPPRLGTKGGLDLRGARRDGADDPPGRGVVDDFDPRRADDLVRPRAPGKPEIEQGAAVIEAAVVGALRERPRRRDRRAGFRRRPGPWPGS
jgi:hypothetical protein